MELLRMKALLKSVAVASPVKWRGKRDKMKMVLLGMTPTLHQVQ